jgi:hypothetical protein
MSLRRTEGGRGVGDGILDDSKSRTGSDAAGPEGAAVVVGVARESGAAGAVEVEGAAGVAGTTGATGIAGVAGDAVAQTAAGNALFGGAGAVPPAGVRPLRSLPHAWQLVCPRKIRLAPQNWHVGFCVPCPSISLNL